jgi:hypothetical protein
VNFFLDHDVPTDANNPQAKAWLLRRGGPLVFTALHALEVRNALKLGVFRGPFAAANAEDALSDQGPARGSSSQRHPEGAPSPDARRDLAA